MNQDLLFPTGGYSAETGGKMKNLRALTNAQVNQQVMCMQPVSNVHATSK